MIKVILLACTFLLSAFLQGTFIHALGHPLSLTPLHFVIGVIILHRLGPELGGLWFLTSTFMIPFIGFDHLPWLSYVVSAIVGLALTTRIFTNRSVYALEGVGITLYAIALVIEWVLRPELLNAQIFVTSLGLCVLSLYIGFLIAKAIETSTKTFLFSSKSQHV